MNQLTLSTFTMTGIGVSDSSQYFDRVTCRFSQIAGNCWIHAENCKVTSIFVRDDHEGIGSPQVVAPPRIRIARHGKYLDADVYYGRSISSMSTLHSARELYIAGQIEALHLLFAYGNERGIFAIDESNIKNLSAYIEDAYLSTRPDIYVDGSRPNIIAASKMTLVYYFANERELALGEERASLSQHYEVSVDHEHLKLSIVNVPESDYMLVRSTLDKSLAPIGGQYDGIEVSAAENQGGQRIILVFQGEAEAEECSEKLKNLNASPMVSELAGEYEVSLPYSNTGLSVESIIEMYDVPFCGPNWGNCGWKR